MCSLTDWDTLKDVKNYFQADEIKFFMEISYLFLTQYYRQMVADQMKKIPSQS